MLQICYKAHCDLQNQTSASPALTSAEVEPGQHSVSTALQSTRTTKQQRDERAMGEGRRDEEGGERAGKRYGVGGREMGTAELSPTRSRTSI